MGVCVFVCVCVTTLALWLSPKSKELDEFRVNKIKFSLFLMLLHDERFL